jgi:hypothetical protein
MSGLCLFELLSYNKKSKLQPQQQQRQQQQQQQQVNNIFEQPSSNQKK